MHVATMTRPVGTGKRLPVAGGLRYNALHWWHRDGRVRKGPVVPAPHAEDAVPLASDAATFHGLRRDRWLLAALCVALVAAVVPLWVSPLLPMMDLPQHLATVRILHSLDDPWFAVGKYHVADFSRTQYLSWYVAVDLLTHLMPLETANRVVLSLYALGLPLSVLALLRAHGRDPALALLAVPLVYNVFFFMGFANYVTALPLLLWALALLQRSLDRPSWPRVVGLAVLVLLLFYSHAQAFVLYVVLATVAVMGGSRGVHPRHWWRAALHLVPALVAMAVWTSRSLILAGEAAWRQGHGGRNVTSTEVHFEPYDDRLRHLYEWWLDAYRDDSDGRIALAWLGVLLATVLAGQGRAVCPETAVSPWRRWLRSKVPLLLTLATLFAYVASPVSYKWIWPISYRLIPVIALLALVTVGHARLAGGVWGRRAVLLLPATLLAVFAAHTHVVKAQQFSREAGPVRAVVARAEPGKKLISLVYGAGSEVLNHAPMLHLGQYYVVDRGGMASFSFANFPQSPVVYPDVGGPPTFPPRFEWTPERFDWREHGSYFDYFLIRGGGQPLAGHLHEVELVVQDGPYRLYRKKPWPSPPGGGT